MRAESIAFGVAGIVFGLIAGWIMGTQQAPGGAVPGAVPAAQTASAAPSGGSGNSNAVAPLDQAKLNDLQAAAGRAPNDAAPRVQLGNIYFDAERYEDAIKWYSEAMKINPRDVDVSTDLGVCLYYTNQPDKALEQFDHSLKIDPKHAKTILNQGIVRAFGKQDLEGAQAAWQQVIALAPDGPEGQAAKRALDSLKSAHTPTLGKPGD
jgi:tetratricopeptide (TPR) repeat protein